MNDSTWIQIGIFAVVILSVIMLFLRLRKNRDLNIRYASLTVEELEKRAKRMAQDHAVSVKRNVLNWPMTRMNDNYDLILSLYKSLNDDVNQKKSVPPAAEWLLDNFYIIEEQVKGVRGALTKKNYYKLPVLKKGPFKGYTRIFAIAIEFISLVDGQVEESTLLKYLEAYQSHSILFDREIRVLPIMMRIALIEHVRMICEKIKDTQREWNKADVLIDKYWSDEVNDLEKMMTLFISTLEKDDEANPTFVEHLFYRLRRSGRSYSNVLRGIDEILDKYGMTAELIAQREHNAQAVSTVSFGNCIMSLKYVSNLNWSYFFESASFVERILQTDPDETYLAMDETSRGYYLRQIETLARAYRVSEIHIAREAIELANKEALTGNSQNETQNMYNRKIHVGYYLLGDGVKQLEEAQRSNTNLRNRLKKKANRNPGRLYAGAISFMMVLLMLLAARYGFKKLEGRSLWLLWGVITVAFIPASEMAITLVNWIVTLLKKPALFPRLELKEGIPEALGTMVVIPVLLNNVDRVSELIKHLESHYLSNPEKNLYFALIGAFKDSKGPNTQKDHPILVKAEKGIKALNLRYAKDNETIFYFYHRLSVHNTNDNTWTGWERKRGALMEFNEMLLGSDETSFCEYSDNIMPKSKIKYIITLDADTILPLGMAKQMIGTMAHPLNTPIVDPNRGIVVQGYGLMQPRISYDIESANCSLFSRILTGQEGMDPYASAISDVYQDLFGEGVFTGKGIYDLRVFHSVLKDIVPENAVLSHDLLEGSYVRAALVSDLELVDSYPTKYNAYMTRLHRWVRGDWQLLPWLGKTIHNRNLIKVTNPISKISKWKITDNLRRSLVAPSLMLLWISGFSILPGSAWFWTGYGLMVMGLPLLIHIFSELVSDAPIFNPVKRHIRGFFGIKSSLFQLIFTIVFLPYQSVLVLNAIGITLYRVLFSRKKMLEWVTSDDAERFQSNTLMNYVVSMGPSLILGVLIVVSARFVKPEYMNLSVILMGFWLTSPLIAYVISKNCDQNTKLLEPEALLELRKIARKTWRYFEEFANDKNNGLAPDNFQEEPNRGVAYRTSPTNIGLGLLATLSARDMGYIGTLEMSKRLTQTLSTIEKLEKWNGHLYNWYDTRTLEPLRPRYISTVDSGNYVCYLMTLAQGLKALYKKPVVDAAYIRGLEDTLQNALVSGKDNPLEQFGFDKNSFTEGIDLHTWERSLSHLLGSTELLELESKLWRVRTFELLKSLKSEVLSFSPWLDQINQMPSVLLTETFEDPMRPLLKLLKFNVNLGDVSSRNTALLTQIDELLQWLDASDMTALSAGPELPAGPALPTAVQWLNDLKVSVETAQSFAQNFINGLETMIAWVDRLAIETRFSVLFEHRRQLFSIGYNIEDNRMTNSYYDLLASEARQASYIAIARGEVPPKHWFMLGRALTVVNRYKGLVSWSGTMFEYLMPLLIMKSYKNTLLDETYSFVIKCQKKYAKERQMPWGISESAFNSLDIHLDYQYKAIGIPWIGLKRGLIEDAVTAPYATFLALMVAPFEAYENIKTLNSQGLEGPYGYYEAADYTPERLTFDQKHVVIKSYMAHHQGMSLLALTNYLNDNIMQTRFSEDPYANAARLLLQERVPTNAVLSKDNKEKIMPFKGLVYRDKGSYRRFTELNKPLPMAHILSNGSYFVMVTDRGTGYSKGRVSAVTRWREDPVIDNYGMFFYVKNKNTNQIWSTTYCPLKTRPDVYEVVFTADKAVYKRTDENIETTTEVIVTSADNAEIRRIKLKNNGEDTCILELTSFFEVVLASQASDVAHPAFGNLFVETEYNSTFNALLAHRRPRSVEENTLWVAHMPVVDGETVGEFQYETDRVQFIGRDRTVKNPIMLERDKPLSGTVGTVLDPALSLRLQLKIEAGRSARISFVTMVADSKEGILELMEKYANLETCDASFWLAFARSEVESKYLNIKAADMELYQNMIKDILYLSPIRRMYRQMISVNHKGQSSLWSYGISGDQPIILVILEKTDEVEILFELLKAHEFWRLKDIKVNLVILINEENSYTNPLSELVKEIVYDNQTSGVLNHLEDVFILNTNNMAEGDVDLLSAIARLIFKGNGKTMSEQLMLEEPLELSPILEPVLNLVADQPQNNLQQLSHIHPNLHFFNGLGGFSQAGDAYIIQLESGQTTPAPWSNVISNPKFGFMVTESGGGYTWSGNSREHKLTPWSNDSVSDQPGEIFYMRDEALHIWSLTPEPIREETPYRIEHGFGYTEFKHNSHGIAQKLVQFVPLEDRVKINLIDLKNEGDVERNLSITYYATPVLGVEPSVTGLHLMSSQLENGTLTVENPYNQEFIDEKMYMDVSMPDRTVTGDRHEFYGHECTGSLETLRRAGLSGTVGAGYNACMAMQVNVSIPPGETLKLVYVLGVSSGEAAVLNEAKQYLEYDVAYEALNQVIAFWKQKLQVVQIQTPESSMNLMLNGWLLYQVISCRLWSRAAFYQSGGAFGFRDQLQDSLAIAAIWPEIAKAQILKHAQHQFREGDVLHWWHEPTNKGMRTRISDDYLWLPYVTAEYVKITGDVSILECEVPFVVDDILKEYEEERYCTPKYSEELGTLYAHCMLSLEHGLNFGEHGLPLMGTGDWNDGMNTVGNGQKGESVWLAWFLYTTLQNFMPICIQKGDFESVQRYVEICTGLVSAVEKEAWDGDWYKRAFFDNGDVLGSAQNSECKIDSLAQTWAVLSGAGNPVRVERAMHALEDYLVMKEEGLIKLLTPPFYEGDLEPGYIKGYVPGVRENGGQYTHAAAWVVAAFAKLGNGDKAHELFELINPVNHTRTNHEVSIYKVEPYVMAADVYSSYPHVGRGGWTWYTGSASWMYKVGVENILGFNKEGDNLIINPCVPKKWADFYMKYQFIDTTYEIKVLNPNHISQGVQKTSLDGVVQKQNVIQMINDGGNHWVEIIMG
ncbi:GH36-type glycosyl hydrolase domain-containing protein [Fusibacter sp. 3D3]|uniref:GH36-type glycosyl hydrolase domain-containing protein n=1 Tax=Fusibacter sp. 3D3 TaxID=1048380 RepID=UPI000858305A|nr:glucoamylase family protein [Fusibacter sp. 3D3]GAU79536.1 cyclic beta-1,2-glucan synthase [Fusibacter sp. 3D3]